MSSIKWVFLPKNKFENRFLGLLTIYDRIVQTLFVLIYEPIIESYSDIYSFGFRSGRNIHQIIGLLASMLSRRIEQQTFFNDPKYLLKFNVKFFFDLVSHNWLLVNFPIYSKFKNIFKQWLSISLLYNTQLSNCFFGFSWGSVIGPLLSNFIFNGLEILIKTSYKKYQSKFCCKWFKSKNYIKKKLIKSSRLVTANRVVRYADDFIIITNSVWEKKVFNFYFILYVIFISLKVNVFNFWIINIIIFSLILLCCLRLTSLKINYIFWLRLHELIEH